MYCPCDCRDIDSWVTRLHRKKVLSWIFSNWRRMVSSTAEFESRLVFAMSEHLLLRVLTAWQAAVSHQIQIRIHILSWSKARRSKAMQSALLYWKAWSGARAGRRKAGVKCEMMAQGIICRHALKNWQCCTAIVKGRQKAVESLTGRRVKSLMGAVMRIWARLACLRGKVLLAATGRAARITRSVGGGQISLGGG